MMVLTIFALWQVPAMIRPLMDTSPVKGHFLSMYVPAEMDADSQEKVAKETDVQTYHAVSWGKLIVGYIQFWTSSNNKRCQIIKE